MRMDAQALIVLAIIGIVAGWLASLVVGGGGLITYLVSGVIGAFVGTWLLSALGVNISIGGPIVSQIIVAAIGAIVVILIARLVT
ncbi:MAG: GlsB/YeaQ/YmgE family stress response membrane protein [Hyphomicrobiaceae bacterium]